MPIERLDRHVHIQDPGFRQQRLGAPQEMRLQPLGPGGLLEGPKARRTTFSLQTFFMPNSAGLTPSVRMVVMGAYRWCPDRTDKKRVPNTSIFCGALGLWYVNGQSRTQGANK
jgi:hypothetical protein